MPHQARKDARRILYLQYFDPAAYPPLERGAWQLLERGWQVRFLGVAPSDREPFSLAPHPNLSVRLFHHTNAGSVLRYYAAALREIFDFRPEIVYCSQEKVYLLGLLASWIGIRAILHEHDTPWIDLPRAAPILRRVRVAFARRAAACVIPQGARAAAFRAETKASNVLVVYNTPALREAPPPSERAARPGLVLWHHGSLGPGRLPLELIHALKLTPEDVELRFAGYETVNTKGFVQALLSLAAELGVRHRVHYLGQMDRPELYAAARAADVGVCLFASEFTEPMVGASNKPYDFLMNGLALLTNDTPEWREFFEHHGVSIGCDPESAPSIANAITWLRDHPIERRAMGARGRALIGSEWNYETSFAPVLATIEAARSSQSAYRVGRSATQQ